jgi:hypothetical protein
MRFAIAPYSLITKVRRDKAIPPYMLWRLTRPTA